MRDGLFIVLEGIDGAGTTTQTARLASRLGALGERVHTTREPTPGPIGSVLRQALTHRMVVPRSGGATAPSWQTMALLFAADRLDHLESEILPKLEDGVIVISDRYDLSSLTYQVSSTDQPSDDTVQWVRSINAHARRPDLTLVLHVTASIAAARRRSRGGNPELYEVDAFQERLARAYRRTDELVPGDKVVHLEGDRDIDVITEELVSQVKKARDARS